MIEFHCPHCEKLLKTPDDKAGVRANCPGCGQTVTVPDSPIGAIPDDESFVARDISPAGLSAESGPDDDVGRAADDTKGCPMCGATIKNAATRCRFCGEDFSNRHTNVPTKIDALEIVSRSWTIYKRQFGLLLGAFLIQIAIGLALGLVVYAALGVAMFSMVGAGGGAPPNPAQLATFITVLGLVLTPIGIAIDAYFDAGRHALMLNVARGEQAEIGDLFRGGKFYARVFLANLVFAIPGMLGNAVQPWIGAGGALIGVLGQFVMLLFLWPCVYIIVDRDVGISESFSLARSLTALNIGPTILLGLVFLLLSFAGVVACCFGWILTIPLGMLTFGVAYCAMCGQAADSTIP